MNSVGFPIATRCCWLFCFHAGCCIIESAQHALSASKIMPLCAFSNFNPAF
jgi:hypothetical protein